MRSRDRRIGLLVLTLLVWLLPAAPATAVVSIDRAELSGGDLRVEGRNASAGATVTVRSAASTATGAADGGGRFRVEAGGFSSPDCRVEVDDGSGPVSASIAGCTPTAPPPPPPPPNQPPVAAPGPDVTVIDEDADGVAVVPLDGSASFDPDGTIVEHRWRIGVRLIALGAVTSASLDVGVHLVELVVRDDDGAETATTFTVTVLANPDPPPLPPSAPLTHLLEGNEAWDGSFDPPVFGASVANAGDVNGDGFEDLIVGSSGFDRPGGLFDEGAAYVFLGGPTGPVGTDPATAHARIVATDPAVLLGFSVDGAGDVNGDGFDDVIVGAHLTDSSGLSVSGAAYVFHGSAQGITATGPADADAVVESKQIQGHLGRAVSGAGDVNGDGFDDVIVGAWLYGEPFDPPIPDQGSGRQGAAFVFHGSPTGIVGTDPATAGATLVAWADGFPSQPDAHFGQAVSSAGDVNGDGFADVLVGAPQWNRARPFPGTVDPPNEGAAFVFLGSATGVVGHDPSDAHARIEGQRIDAFLGGSVADAGDVNGDGFGDILVGAAGYPAGDPLLLAEEGAAFVFHGSAAGITATTPADADFAVQGTELAEWVGRDVRGAGDLDGDGFDDILVGARTFFRALPEEGVAYAFSGSPTGIVGSTLADASFRVASGQEDTRLGVSVAAADVDGDGRPDPVVGASTLTNGEVREGGVFVFASGATGPPPNRAPVARPTAPSTTVDVDLDGVEAVALDGTASTDADGTITSYVWSVADGTVVAQGAQTTAVLPEGATPVTLTVTDDRGATGSATVIARVVAGAPNTSPVAVPGPDQTVVDDDGDGLATVTLDGTASFDPDGTIIRHSWTLGTTVLGVGVVLTTSLPVGQHTVFLRVDDDDGATTQASLVVTVEPGGTPPPPPPPPPDEQPSLALTLTGPASVGRGGTVTFTATIDNTGTVTSSGATITLSVSPDRRVRDLSPGGAVAVGAIPAGGQVVVTWSGRTDKQGSATATATVTAGGAEVATATHAFTVTR